MDSHTAHQKTTATPPRSARPATKLATGDAEYHAKIASRVEWARAAQQEIAAVEAATQSWVTHLAAKYDLGEGDEVTDDGTIIRKARLDG